jgi:hypothetical protein
LHSEHKRQITREARRSVYVNSEKIPFLPRHFMHQARAYVNNSKRGTALCPTFSPVTVEPNYNMISGMKFHHYIRGVTQLVR